MNTLIVMFFSFLLTQRPLLNEPFSDIPLYETPLYTEQYLSSQFPENRLKNTSNDIIKNFIQIRYADKNDVFLAPGEAFNILINTRKDANIYCYYENQKSEISRFFPNRFKSEPFVLNSIGLTLPGELPFELRTSKEGVSERLACFATEKNVLNRLPPEVVGIDFEALPVQSLEEVKAIYYSIDDADVTDTFFDVRVF